MAASKQLQALLAMPASLRPVMLGASAQLRLTPTRLFSTSTVYHATPKYPNVAALLVPEFRTSPLAEISPDELFKSSSLSSAPNKPVEDELTKLFTKVPAVFAHAGSDFYQLKKNTRIPEVCILGRSNVGKSSFVNALANRQSNSLAWVSSKAGRTRSINTYGFGPPPSMKALKGQAAEFKGKEDIPNHTFHLVDMPGYGHASLKEWGRNIALYLNKRNGVQGAIVLIDAEVGPKDSDFHLLELLSRADLRTAIVLTKADKVKSGLEGMRKTCEKLWDGIRDIENRLTETRWGWERDIFVTAVGARDHAVVSSTVTTARLAVARLAGLVKDDRPAVAERDRKWSGKIISFDDLEYAPSKVTAAPAQDTESMETSASSHASKVAENSITASSSFAELEQASKVNGRGATRPRINTAFSNDSWNNTPRAHARAFHTTTTLPRAGDRRGADELLPRGRQSQPGHEEFQRILSEFVSGLTTMPGPKDELRRMQQARERRSTTSTTDKKSNSNSLQKLDQRQAQQLRKRFPEQAARTQAVHERRLTREQEKQQRRRESVDLDAEWPADTPPRGGGGKRAKGMSEVVDADVFNDAFDGSSGLGGKVKIGSKGGQTKAGKKAAKQREALDPFEAQFAQRTGGDKGHGGGAIF
ncbi:Uu.00g129700.m01.CDS01 [Anthostomella pinea]|uniref:Uu.00g129700.m01.CDS01 n=1 Tax=Anthostomella pinea TaxID=933095 RepID=A0AAI8VJ99_9PEZI|nr:Uu.00g129700.m01.CDS01 [Anthostomella pinea]